MLNNEISSSNVNTPKYWDDAFKEEWKVLQGSSTATATEKYNFYRWDGLKFEMVSNKMPLKGKLLDIGCGLGHFCRYMKARNFYLDIYGCDFSSYAIRKAREIAKICGMEIKFKLGGIEPLPYEDNTFDIVSAQEIIEHISYPEEFLKEIWRILKPNGKMFLTTPYRGILGNEGTMSDEHVREWTPKELSPLIYKYFGNGEMIFPPIMVSTIKDEIKNIYWFLAIATKCL